MNTAPRRWALALLTLAGVLTNVASNFVGPVPDIEDCAPDSTTVELEGDKQVGAATAPLGRGLAVRVSCQPARGGARVAVISQQVQWRVVSGGGRVNGAATALTYTEPADGRAAVLWQLGAAIGTQTVSAELQGRTLTFSAQAGGEASGGTCVGGAGTTFEAERLVVGDERWTLAGSPYRGGRVRVERSATLTIDAGVTACLSELAFSNFGRLQALGDATQPVDLKPPAGSADATLRLAFSPLQSSAPTSLMRHVRAVNVAPIDNPGHALLLEDSQFSVTAPARARVGCARLYWLVDSGSAGGVRRVVLDGYGGAAPCDGGVLLVAQGVPASGAMPFEARVLNAAGDAVRVIGGAAGAFMLSNCEISGAGRHGLVLDGTGSRAGAGITACNLTGNVGHAVLNQTGITSPATAQGNWWGDAAGPAAAGPNAVSPAVDASRPASAPLRLGY